MIFFFSKANIEELQNLKFTLMVFCHISGLKINLEKSFVVGINVSGYYIQDLALLLECKILSSPLPI